MLLAENTFLVSSNSLLHIWIPFFLNNVFPLLKYLGWISKLFCWLRHRNFQGWNQTVDPKKYSLGHVTSQSVIILKEFLNLFSIILSFSFPINSVTTFLKLPCCLCNPIRVILKVIVLHKCPYLWSYRYNLFLFEFSDYSEVFFKCRNIWLLLYIVWRGRFLVYFLIF